MFKSEFNKWVYHIVQGANIGCVLIGTGRMVMGDWVGLILLIVGTVFFLLWNNMKNEKQV